MIFYYHFHELPQITMAYSVIRRTVWRIADPYHILIFVKSGHCRIQTDGQTYLLSEGDLFYLPPDCQYERTPVNDEFCEMTYLHFVLPVQGEILDPWLAHQRLSAQEDPNAVPPEGIVLYLSQQTAMKKDEYLEASFAEIIRCAAGGFSERQLANAALCRILTALSAVTVASVFKETNPSAGGQRPAGLKKALQYIAQHYTEKITLGDLCRVSFVSKQMMIRYFYSEFGKTPIAYILEYKIDKIKEMLMTYPDVSIKELCGEFGFDDQCYFSRAFRRITGETPSAYRVRVTHFDEKAHLQENPVPVPRKDNRDGTRKVEEKEGCGSVDCVI